MIGQRIRRARKAAGLSLRELAGRTGLSHTAIAKFESDELTPTSDRLLSLAQALGVRVEYFFRPRSLDLETVQYRKHSKLRVKTLDRIRGEVLDRAERLVEVLDFFPQRPVACFDLPDSLPREIDDLSKIESAAEELREGWRLGIDPIADLSALLEENGILVLAVEMSSDGKFDGLACRVDGLPVVVVGADWPGDRQRFTLAHELGHLVLARRLTATLDVEQACNRFAGAFLAPAAAVRGALGERRHSIEPRELYALKHELGMSMQAVLYRAKDLSIVTEATFQSTMRDFSRRGWRRDEPGEPVAPERPQLLDQLVYRALAEDLIGESKAAELLGLPISRFHSERLLESIHAVAGH